MREKFGPKGYQSQTTRYSVPVVMGKNNPTSMKVTACKEHGNLYDDETALQWVVDSHALLNGDVVGEWKLGVCVYCNKIENDLVPMKTGDDEYLCTKDHAAYLVEYDAWRVGGIAALEQLKNKWKLTQ